MNEIPCGVGTAQIGNNNYSYAYQGVAMCV